MSLSWLESGDNFLRLLVGLFVRGVQKWRHAWAFGGEPTSGISRNVTDVDDVHVVRLSGELDIATAHGLAEWLAEISGSTVVVDLSELTFMDSSGIASMVMARNHMLETGDVLVLTRPNPIVRRALEVVGLADLLSDWDERWSLR